MGKHILTGDGFPFYMWGQNYNGGAAWEAYVAAASFGVFGVGVVALKGCIVVLSLLCLVLFYRMAWMLYGIRTAAVASLLFAFAPTLLKWHMQVRGYSWYFLSLPCLTALFLGVTSARETAAVWTTQSFTFPLIFESDETLGASAAIFGVRQNVYPASIAQPRPDPAALHTFVIESDSPIRLDVLAGCRRKTGLPPVVTPCGAMMVVQEVAR